MIFRLEDEGFKPGVGH